MLRFAWLPALLAMSWASPESAAEKLESPHPGDRFVVYEPQVDAAGRDGNVYKKSEGQWQQRDASGNWSSVQKPETSRQLQNDAAARDRGYSNAERRSQRPSGRGGRGGGRR